jgi:ribosomal protein S17E
VEERLIMAFRSYKEESRRIRWGTSGEGSLTLDQINTGCLLRIADSLERMEEPYLVLLRNVEVLKKSCETRESEIENLRNRIAGYKAHITKMKRRGFLFEVKKGGKK